MSRECSVDIAIECCNLTIAEQLQRIAPAQGRMIAHGMLSSEETATDKHMMHRQKRERYRHRSRASKVSSSESEEELRKSTLTYVDKATLRAFGQKLRRAARLVDLIWAEAMRESVRLSFHAWL